MGLNFNELFPSWKCSAHEFYELFPKGTALTVERVETRKDSRGGPQSDDEFAVCYFHELKKPISLNKTNAQLILSIAQSPDTDDWDGVVVFAMAMPFEYTDDHGDRQFTRTFRLYKPKPNVVIELEPKSDLTKMLATERRRQLQASPKPTKNTAEAEVIGFDKAVSLFAHMRMRNKEWSDVIDFAQKNGMAKQLEARIPPELPKAALSVANMFLKHVPATKDVDQAKLRAELQALWYPPPVAVEGEVIDRDNGEVKPPASVGDDDIPF